MKKILLSATAAATALAMVPMFAAFEAHVVNVTARIENALSVSTDAIDFGTVFPQEHLDKPLSIALSQSFEDEGRVDDVQYFIRQKPKCAVTEQGGTVMLDFQTAPGHLSVNQETGAVSLDCGPAPEGMPTNATWGVLPSLCEYISKEGDEEPDGTTPSFHQPWTVVQGNNPDTEAVEAYYIDYLDTPGYLAKSDEDLEDTWTIDLAVPCFGGFCAQDWLSFVQEVTGNENMTLAEANAYAQPIENEHKVFGCDLWVEVGGVSEMQPIRIERTQPGFGDGGWAGWSCPANTTAVGGGIISSTNPVGGNGVAATGSPAVDGSSYPVYPHYTFGSGETGYVVHDLVDGFGNDISFFVNCLPN